MTTYQLLGLLHRLLDSAYVEECLFGEMVHLAIENHTETSDGIFNGDHDTRYARKLLCHISLSRSERIAKYNRLLKIEEELKGQSVYGLIL